METLKITVEDQYTKEMVVRMLHAIKGVNIKEEKRNVSRKSAAALNELAGIWADRDISLADLRYKAWQRKSVS